MTAIPKRILLVEDDASMRKFIEIVLSKAGYSVTSADDGLSAMQHFIDGDAFDAVVTDAIMPNLSGYELCRLVRARREPSGVPFIILSGLEENAADNGFCDAFLSKDTDLKENLLKTLERLIR
jgi:CheY-like chemotaxis protein